MRYIGREMSKSRYLSRKILIVDGYNVINAWSKLKHISIDDLEESRNILIGHILEYSKIKGYEAYVVFDAYNVKGNEEKVESFHGIKVIFTKEHQTADTYIEKFISSLSKYDEVAVVTSDYAEQQIILGKGGVRIPARELINDLKATKERLRQENKERYSEKNSMNRLENKIDSLTLDKLEQIRRRTKK